MDHRSSLKIRSIVQLYEKLTEEERIITEVLRQIITNNYLHIVKKEYHSMCHTSMVIRNLYCMASNHTQEAE
ncbi:MAG: hypothetical protein ABIR81_01525 [Ginsengibacter sp.]